MQIHLPKKAVEAFASPAPFKIFYGGRGAGRSWSMARMALARSFEKQHLILCTRQYQKSTKDSIHRLLAAQITALGFSKFFDVQKTTIINRVTETPFVFYGLHHNPESIKSLEGVTITLCEESEKLTKDGIDILEPTVMRTENPEMWIAFNPQEETDPVYKHYVKNANADTFLCKMNWSDNPFFPEALNQRRLHMARTDPEAYQHVWEGGFRSRSESQVLKGKWQIDAFEPSPTWDGPYFGADWGFSVDPTTLVKLWIDGNTLYVEDEVYEVGLELDAIGYKFKKIEGAESHTIRADNARPETISYLNRTAGLRIEGAAKGKGSVEDGISFLRAFDKIIIHDRCRAAAEEARLWSYKTDRLSGDVMPKLVDKHNHIWDAARYALEPIMKKDNLIGFNAV